MAPEGADNGPTPGSEALRAGAEAAIHLADLALAVGDRVASGEMWDVGAEMLREHGFSSREVAGAMYVAAVNLEKRERGIKR